MFRDVKSMCDIGAVAMDERLVFLGFLGCSSFIALYNRETMAFIGLYNFMCGSPTRMLVLSDLEKLVCSTSAGYLYVWDTSDKTVERLTQITNDPLTLDGFVHPSTRVVPVTEVTSTTLESCVDVDRVPGTSIVVMLAADGELTFFDITGGAKLTSKKPIETENYQALCLIINDISSTFRNRNGHWAAIGFTKGLIALIFIPLIDNGSGTKKVDIDNVFAVKQNTDDGCDVNCLAFRKKSSASSSTTIIAGCSDGAVRCFVFKKSEDEIQLHKSASYVHCRAAKKGQVLKLISGCHTNGTPYVVSLCRMQMPYDYHTQPLADTKATPADSSTYCTEIIMQTLLQDQCEEYVVLAHIRDMVSDLTAGIDNSSYIYTTYDDPFVIRRLSETNEWQRAKRIEWNTPTNRKLLLKLL
ncbi:uncharacterized protein BXIN_0197 [Babesia sp. Xinjiang]|uniref:uncharacterized protein n=1 Tax=Babesia sp. Xinjiang TaxID=462227 RepID=UPI000A25BB29|nr:uncharacterized protein BXIN_0197 [Babesia sp. Xinjiang]ORM39839.1 hypothetical protein BXIN_0197 [Babesia sp. Xinjiang]